MLEKDQVSFLSKYIEQSTSSIFEVNKLDTSGKNFLPGFQKGKTALAGFEVTKHESMTTYLLVFVNAGENNHLMIFSHNKSKVMAELKKIEEVEGVPCLIWKYNPAKRDGKNQERKDYFQKTFGSTLMQIPLPTSSSEIEAFFIQLFALCQNRLEADSIGG